MKTMTSFKSVVLVLIALVTCMMPVRAGSQDADVLSDRQVLAETGRTIDQWGARWWQWAYDNPDVLGDTTGEFADLGHVPGRVFFAEGSGGDRVRATVEVPGGKHVLLPVATYLWTFFDPCANVKCARKIVNDNFLNGIIDVSVQIDGERVRNMSAHRVRVDNRNPLVFKVDAGPIGPDGYGGILNAVEAGYWLMLEPLPPGKHKVSMSATVPNLDPFTGELVGGYTDLDAKLTLLRRR